jgi:Protein of unknown function (DUF3306)
MSAESNFLSRWSRLKRQAEEKRAPPDSGSPVSAEAELPPGSPGALTTAPALPELTPEELAALPRLEDLTPQTDLTPFMRLGVPTGLRNSALRRMWELDPAIRDRVGDALDYAYDWNVAGSVPGSGPLLPIDDVESMLRSIVGEPEPERVPETRTVSTKDSRYEEPQISSAAPSEQVAASSPASPLSLDNQLPVGNAASAEPSQKVAAQGSPRRHGGATPF